MEEWVFFVCLFVCVCLCVCVCVSCMSCIAHPPEWV
jgi:hypothetical protein